MTYRSTARHREQFLLGSSVRRPADFDYDSSACDLAAASSDDPDKAVALMNEAGWI